jgi:hypothetical protein
MLLYVFIIVFSVIKLRCYAHAMQTQLQYMAKTLFIVR